LSQNRLVKKGAEVGDKYSAKNIDRRIMNKKPSILVTGASGFLGRHIVPVLEKRYPETEIIALSSKV
jgi:FlaA1/EpsC-like NDP-sugar epimerase